LDHTTVWEETEKSGERGEGRGDRMAKSFSFGGEPCLGLTAKLASRAIG